MPYSFCCSSPLFNYSEHTALIPNLFPAILAQFYQLQVLRWRSSSSYWYGVCSLPILLSNYYLSVYLQTLHASQRYPGSCFSPSRGAPATMYVQFIQLPLLVWLLYQPLQFSQIAVRFTHLAFGRLLCVSLWDRLLRASLLNRTIAKAQRSLFMAVYFAALFILFSSVRNSLFFALLATNLYKDSTL